MRIDQVVSFAVLSLSVGACAKAEKSSGAETTAVITNIGRPQVDTTAASAAPMTLNLSSLAFAANGPIPTKYTCEGAGVSPPLAWSGAPSSAKSFALIVEDPDAPDPAKPTRVVSHWVAYNIPAATTALAENASKTGMPAGSAQGSNERGTQAYMGPCPPIGSHRYFFKLYAIDTVLTGLKNPKKANLQQAIQKHVVDSTQLIGTYQKTKK
ncbi:MAG TPA: YbhB/YbcL family Raf kinase inhibitor-like protein [Gemmatimonadaceae bacterium]